MTFKKVSALIEEKYVACGGGSGSGGGSSTCICGGSAAQISQEEYDFDHGNY